MRTTFPLSPRKCLLLLALMGAGGCGPSGKPTGTTADPVEKCERVADVCRFDKSKLGVCTQARSGSTELVCQSQH